MRLDIAPFPSHCGSRILHGFGNYDSFSKTSLKIQLHKESYRTFFSIFINQQEQHTEYKKLSQMFKILYQSPILVNPSTGRQYFIVIFLNEKP
jgi:hypothetical protein